MTKSDQYARSLLHNAKPKPWDFCPSLARLHTNDVDLRSVSSVHRTRIKGVEVIGEEMEMEMALRWTERGKENERENENGREMERGEKKEKEKEKENTKVTNNNATGERSKKQKKVEREKSVDEIWKGVWT
ncbi:hypothetical protein BOTCAL_0084g00190 [Botryotinia calthae]|uniref:Uncharacterized protein n=1 Tax=Botryotinia calthae TaxID=38488 RepID=A0A4Y8D810_9HELO|nr:hypothetical protein BOTCAL_0084g00190 [Botryotinia calthae]